MAPVDSTMVQQSGGAKFTGIKQIVGLKGMLQKWQTVTFGSRPNAHNSKGNHGDVSQPIRKGYLAVYFGPELRRFIISTSYLSHHVFKILLEKAEEEFGYDHNGGRTLPCEIETFKYLLSYIENQPKGHNVGGDPISEIITLFVLNFEHFKFLDDLMLLLGQALDLSPLLSNHSLL
ncbi:protein SMALL AUXIN UP-REGULATED RNA 10-like [Hibiscus syriacus]|uniref:protein SMALL AUXIN UP-REGULATED RNA 10-like n=1 Tax=Hibiscus syriacus TaxID=106335 RepID=UPI001921995D|nr:protein SMALL AUXIN UP-REGULATED RNA 10-like [Hibiscus syriacus]